MQDQSMQEPETTATSADAQPTPTVEKAAESAADTVTSKAEPASAAASSIAQKTFTTPPKIPVFVALPGVYYDFNYGTRVFISENALASYRVVIMDTESGLILYNNVVPKGSFVRTAKSYYCRTRILIYDADKANTPPKFDHVMNLEGMPVLVELAGNAIGDNIAWFSYIERFQQKHSANLTVAMGAATAGLFKDQYKNIRIITHELAEAAGAPMYATFRIGLFFKGNTDRQPFDFRYVGLHRTAGHILGLTTEEELADCPPRVDLSAPRTIKGKYVVIAVQASSKAKLWNNPGGWRKVIAYLKDKGYRVLCIDKDAEATAGYTTNAIPNGCEDFTGNIPLQERVNIIKDADMFIGLSSGLAWLAWCCRVPVIMISGFTDPYNEFYTPYRVHNTHVCHGCWHGCVLEFDHQDYFWCPRKKTAREKFECTIGITPIAVFQKIDKVLEDRAATRGKRRKR